TMIRFILPEILIQLTLGVALTSVTQARHGTPPQIHGCCGNHATSHGNDKEDLEPAASEHKRPNARGHKKDTKKTVAALHRSYRDTGSLDHAGLPSALG